MKKITSILLVAILALTACFFGGCKDYSNYKNEPGYEAYISNDEIVYEYAPYFNFDSDWYEDEKAREYYNNNVRRCGDYLITNYEDGVCINRYCGYKNAYDVTEIDIPETLDGKPVVKIGQYLIEEKSFDGENKYYYQGSPFGEFHNCILNIPSTVKYISRIALYEAIGMTSDTMEKQGTEIIEINVDKENPYYSSENGILFSKDKKILLYHPDLRSPWGPSVESKKYVVPDYVEIFAPSGLVSMDWECLVFGKNIKQIDTFVIDDNACSVKDYHGVENYRISLKVKGYKGTVAEKWAEENYLEFVALD